MIKESSANRSWSRRGRFILLVIVAAALWVIYPMAGHQLAPGQKPLADIHDIETLRAQFNRDAGTSRLIILVSPT
ncbi:MAG TPA: hypothetical protein VN843_08430 [Anaerolineales bacterium]|nr:hypothetical protein [Anaerolineales bacterium]